MLSKTTHKIIDIRLFIFICVLTNHLIANVQGSLKCHQCNGINCLRSTYDKTQECSDQFDLCVTVFDNQMVLAQGCYQQLSAEMRTKCNSAEDTANVECYKCHGELCNNVGAGDYMCIQCDSEKHQDCRNNPAKFTAERCEISRAANSYCYVIDAGKRTIRGCAGKAAEQKKCLDSNNCMLCLPSELSGCNAVQIDDKNDNGGNNGTNGNGCNNGTDNGTNGNGCNNGTDNGTNGNGGNNGNGNGGSHNFASAINSNTNFLNFNLLLFFVYYLLNC